MRSSVFVSLYINAYTPQLTHKTRILLAHHYGSHASIYGGVHATLSLSMSTSFIAFKHGWGGKVRKRVLPPPPDPLSPPALIHHQPSNSRKTAHWPPHSSMPRPCLPGHLLFLSFTTGPQKQFEGRCLSKKNMCLPAVFQAKKYIGININRHTYTDIYIPKCIYISCMCVHASVSVHAQTHNHTHVHTHTHKNTHTHSNEKFMHKACVHTNTSALP